MTSFTIEQKRVDIFPCTEPDRPVIYLNTYGREGKQVLQHLQEAGCPAFTLVAVSHLNWDHDMAPWDIPPISEKDTPCTGGADDYLAQLLREIVPRAEKTLPGAPAWRGCLPCMRSIGPESFPGPPVSRAPCGSPGFGNTSLLISR